jgi:hypothetical protein
MEQSSDPRDKTHIYSQLIFDKGTYFQEKAVPSINGAGKTGNTHTVD